jgi:hypothetical protein
LKETPTTPNPYPPCPLKIWDIVRRQEERKGRIRREVFHKIEKQDVVEIVFAVQLL